MKLSQQDMASIMESALFAIERPLSIRDFLILFRVENIGTKDIKQALSILVDRYNTPLSGVELQEIAQGWQLRTKEENKHYIRRLAKRKLFQLSSPAMEVLSIIAYRQPCRKAEIDEIRGIESSHLLHTLMEKRLIQFGPRSSMAGRPQTYKTTERFLEIFGLKNLKELPVSEEIVDLLPDESKQGILVSEAPNLKSVLSTTMHATSRTGREQQDIEKELDFVSEKIRSTPTMSVLKK